MMLSQIDYHVNLVTFSGPLDLLLQLVERNRLPVTELSLAQVTDDYLERVSHLDVAPEEMSKFLLIASRLLLIKSRALLEIPTEAEEEGQEDLVSQLALYQSIKRASSALESSFGRITYPQMVPPKIDLPLPPIVQRLSSSLLLHAVDRLVLRSTSRPISGPTVAKFRWRLRDALSRLEQLLSRNHTISFSQVVTTAPRDRQFVVVAFLAILDAARRGLVVLSQDRPFGTIQISRNGENSDG